MSVSTRAHTPFRRERKIVRATADLPFEGNRGVLARGKIEDPPFEVPIPDEKTLKFQADFALPPPGSKKKHSYVSPRYIAMFHPQT